MIYRYATLEDSDALVEIARDEWIAAMNTVWGNMLTADEDGIRAFIVNMLSTGSAALLAVTEEGEIAGCLALMVGKYYWAKENMLVEHGLFVRPKFRKSRIAFNLVKWAKEIAQKSNLVFSIAQMSNLEPERVEKFYVKLCGLTKVGGCFRSRL